MRQAWLQDGTTEPGKTPLGMNLSGAASPTQVRAGIYVNRIGDFAMKEAGWTADFDIWFRWSGKTVKPGETFQITNGTIESREKREEYVREGEHYERYHVKARMAKFFDPNRFPLADEPLTIAVDDTVHGVGSLQYVADTQDSGISPAAVLQKLLRIKQSGVVVKTREYGSRRGDLRAEAGSAAVRSQLIFAMLINQPGGGYFVTLFTALFTSVAIAFIAFYIKPIHVDPRFGLGVGALFAAIGNSIYVGPLLPRAGEVTLTDMINLVGLITIFLTLVQSTISLYLFDTLGLEKLSRFFDKVSFAAFLLGYTAINLVLPFAARP